MSVPHFPPVNVARATISICGRAKEGAPRIAVHKQQEAEREGKGTLHAFAQRWLLIGEG